MRIFLTILLTILLYTPPLVAQMKVNYNLFNRSFDLPLITPTMPQPAQLITPRHQLQNNFPSPGSFGPGQYIDNRTERNNQQIMQEVDQYEYRHAQLETMKNATIRDAQQSFTPADEGNLALTQSYRQAFLQLNMLDPDSFSVTKAVYLVENAYFGNKMPFSQFTSMLQQRVNIVRQLLKREGLSDKNNLALNYAIQQLYQKEIPFKDTSGKSYVELPFKYDFDDFRGDKDYRKMFVSKMLATNTGQCHSGPLAYLCLAEQLGTKAFLSLAPQHSFIRFSDNKGKLFNFETTNGHIVSESWLVQSGYITTKALKNKTYLDTLSQRQLYAQVLGDLLLGYLAKFHKYDGFADQIRQTILKINPNNLTGLIVGANLKVLEARKQIQQAGMPRPGDLSKYPDAYMAYLAMMAALRQVDDLGYQDMPKEAYQKWLKSIEQEKQRQANQEQRVNLEREILQIKKLQEAIQKQLKQ